jgi:hypothetical protein
MSKSVAMCGLVLRPLSQAEIRRRADGTAYEYGPVRCGSPWACPWCAPKIAAARAGEIADLIARARARGLHPFLLTLTLRHSSGMALAPMLAGVARAWRAFVAGRWWLALRDALGISGWVRGVESTHGPNGWHPHVHVLALSSATADDWARHRPMIAGRWSRIVRRILGPDYVPDDVHGVDVRPTDASSYVAKLAFEVTGDGKSAARGHRTPWDIARAVAERGDPADVALWKEWQTATYGHRALTWSQGARDILGREPKTDEECAEEPTAPTDVVVATFSAPEWRVLMLAGALSTLLDLAETSEPRDVYVTAWRIIHERARAGDALARAVVTSPWCACAHWRG